ncbi:MAG: hypothetical protein J5829_08320 [Lachnospiraceae bacterium]|nr:hypothetical protein [Lachnospiraceae bacterium]
MGKNEPEQTIEGRKVTETLAQTYKQLYIAPGDDMLEKYNDIVLKGKEPEKRDLSHFVTSDRDRLEYVGTPAGDVLCVTLFERRDFETFLRIMANRCSMADIPDTQGASILDGVINWKKINDHKEEFFREAEKNGILVPDWQTEFQNFTSDRNNFKDVLIILSVGPYSNTPAKDVGIPDDEWISLSHTIRKYHESTHFICRRKFREKINAVWDELVADAVGIYAAFGKPDTEMEKRFLGIEGEVYTGGRLENYVEADDPGEKKEQLNILSSKIAGVLERFEKIMTDNKDAEPFDMTIILEGYMEELWTDK